MSQYYLNGDSLIGGISYHRITGPSESGWLREDNKVIYFIPDTSTTEYKLYDFNLGVGDSAWGIYGGVQGCGSDPMVVVWEDSVLASDGYHRTLRFDNDVTWIEGVGSVWYLLYPGLYLCVSGNDNITCAMSDSLFDYSPYGYSCTNVGQPTLAVSKEWTLYPNPTHESFAMDWEDGEMEAFVLTDVLGRVIWEMKAENAIGKQFELPSLGVYLVIAQKVTGETSVKRLVRE